MTNEASTCRALSAAMKNIYSLAEDTQLRISNIARKRRRNEIDYMHALRDIVDIIYDVADIVEVEVSESIERSNILPPRADRLVIDKLRVREEQFPNWYHALDASGGYSADADSLRALLWQAPGDYERGMIGVLLAQRVIAPQH